MIVEGNWDALQLINALKKKIKSMEKEIKDLSYQVLIVGKSFEQALDYGLAGVWRPSREELRKGIIKKARKEARKEIKAANNN
jgi:hypothetical protein